MANDRGCPAVSKTNYSRVTSREETAWVVDSLEGAYLRTTRQGVFSSTRPAFIVSDLMMSTQRWKLCLGTVSLECIQTHYQSRPGTILRVAGACVSWIPRDHLSCSTSW